MVAVGEALHHLRGGLLPRKIQEELLDVLNLEGSLLKRVLLETIFHGSLSIAGGSRSGASGGSLPYSARSAAIGSTRVARRAGT